MKLRHFLYGKDPVTDDFLTLVSSSNVTKPELKYWEKRVGVLISELRDYGVPGDFMRLLISGQRADEWAYVRARTGGDRSRFDFQAVMLSSEELAWLGWQPWALDGVLFSGNTNDWRVQEALKGDAASSGHEYNQRVVGISFEDGRAEPYRLTEKQEEMVERLTASLADTGAPETRWYFDEGQVGEEAGRQIIARVLGGLYDMNLKVPGFVMGIASVRESGLALGISRRNDDRFSDIRLASYVKSLDGLFPFENWRDAGGERTSAAYAGGLSQRRPGAGAEQSDDGLSRTEYEEQVGPDNVAVSTAPGLEASEEDARLDDSPAPSFADARPDRMVVRPRAGSDAYRSRSTAHSMNAYDDNKLYERLNAGLEWLERPVSLKHALPVVVLLLALSNILTYAFSGGEKPAPAESTSVGASSDAQAGKNQNQVSLSEPDDAKETQSKESPEAEPRSAALDERPSANVQYVSENTPCASERAKVAELTSIVNAWAEAYDLLVKNSCRPQGNLARRFSGLRAKSKKVDKATTADTANRQAAGPVSQSGEQKGAVKPDVQEGKTKDQKKETPLQNPTPGAVASPRPSSSPGGN